MRPPVVDRRWLLAGLGLAALIVTAAVLRQQGQDPAPAPTSAAVSAPSGAPATAAAPLPDEPASAEPTATDDAEPAPAPAPSAGAAKSRCSRVSDDGLEAIGEGAPPGVEITGPAFFVLTRGTDRRTWVIAARIESADRLGAGIWATPVNPGKKSGLIGPFVALDGHARRASAWPAEAPPRRLGPRPDGRAPAAACLRAGRRV